MDIGLPGTFNLNMRIFSLLLILLILNGCTNEKAPAAAPAPLPDITTAYLLEHRIISHEPKFGDKIIATLPYEITRFEESYLIYLIAYLPVTDAPSSAKTAGPRYYLWLERRSDGWRDFTEVFSVKLSNLKISSRNSAIRTGLFYKEYTIDLTRQQLAKVQDSGLDLLLINEYNYTSEIEVPSHYIKAFLKILDEQSQ